MSIKERDLLRVRGMDPNGQAIKQRDRSIVYGDISNTRVATYGIRSAGIDTENWWDTLSSMMQGSHESSIKSLSDDNRDDEKEIEILDAASKITDDTISQAVDLKDTYVSLQKEALLSGNSDLAEHYRKLAIEADNTIKSFTQTREQADTIVKRDKQLFSWYAHNPILEAIGEIFDYTTTGAGIGAVAGSHIPVLGNIVGGAVGGIAGLTYGMYDLIASHRNQIDRSSYTNPLSENRNENYADAIKTRQSYKDFRSNAIANEQEDLLYWQTKYPVSDVYRYKEQSGEGSYLYYNLPGIIGSSFSDTKDMDQQMISAYGLNNIARKVGGSKTKFTLNVMSFISALRNGYQQSLNENHAEATEVSEKKAVAEINKNPELKKEMLSGAKNVAMRDYGISKEEADNLIDPSIALMMYQGGIGGLNPHTLRSGYSYYKAARQLGDPGADTQFERDMMATAGSDVLEAAWMALPIGRLASKYKTLGRAVAGGAIGYAAGEMAGFGVGGGLIGGAAGALAAQWGLGRKLWRNTAGKTQEIADKILPSLQNQIISSKVGRVAAAFGTSTLAEAAEEGVQYLNSLDAEKVLKDVDEELGLRSITNLFTNDLKKRGEVFNAVLSQFGLTDSPYQNDAEFWSNYKGGLVLGGIMTGSMAALNEGMGAKKAYSTAKFLQNEILNTALANRTESLDAILKGQAFAKFAFNNNADAVLEILETAKEKNRNRENTPYTDKDFDDLIQQANRIINASQYGPTRKRLEALGYTLGSDEANLAIAVDEYYTRRHKAVQNEQVTEGRRKESQLLVDPELLQALDDVAPLPQVTSEDEYGGENGHTFQMTNADGSTSQVHMSDREVKLELHKTAAQFIAVAQLLKDMNNVTDIMEFAKKNGIAFSKNQLEQSISILKGKLNDLRNNLQLYSNSTIDANAEYDRQIQDAKSHFLSAENGMKLVDVYRDTNLRDLNARVYANIVRSVGISTTVEATEEVKRKSKDMVKRFSDNIQKNKDLQEIVDYYINTEFEDRYNGETDIEDVKEPESGFENMSPEELTGWIEDQNMSDYDLKIFLTDKIEEEKSKAERRWFRPFGNQKHRDMQDKWQSIYDAYFGTEDAQQQEEPETPPVQDLTEPQAVEGSAPEVSPVQVVEAAPDVEEGNDLEETVIETNDNVVEEAAIATNDNNVVNDDEGDQGGGVIQDEGDTTHPVEDTGDDRVVEPEGEPAEQVDLQQQTVDKIKQPDKDAPKKLIDGWYVTKDGKIIPSERMYFENGVTVSYKMRDLYEKYLETAAMIRVRISKFIGSRTKSDRTKHKNFNDLKAYVAKTINIGNPDILNPIATALMNNDKNAIKLLITMKNKRTWFSYVTNNFFRAAAKDILNGRPVQRPAYIDADTFNKFFSDVTKRYNTLKSRYTFITDTTPHITTINGEQVVADPDIIAVDKAGNAHIFNIYATNQQNYEKMQQSAETYTINQTTKTRYSQHEERTWYATVQFNALRDSAGVTPSSMALLPICVNDYGGDVKVDSKTGDVVYVMRPNSVTRITLGKLIPMIPDDSSLSKYQDNEDQLKELKVLLKNANRVTKEKVETHNQQVDFIRKYRNEHREFTKEFRGTSKLDKRTPFVPEEEPASIAEAYAQINKCWDIVESINRYYQKHIRAEYEEIQRRMRVETNSPQNTKTDLQKEIDEINAMPDETKTTGIEIEVVGGEAVVNNKDFIANGVFKAVLATSQNGDRYVKYVVEYKGKTYDIKIQRQKHRGVKWNSLNNSHSGYTAKKQAIDIFLNAHPEVVLTFDVQRSFISYEEKPNDAKPIGLEEKESIITAADIDNIGIQQNDGKLVDIGFYDEKTGLIQTGQTGSTAVLGGAPDGAWTQNQLFLVIRQKRTEASAQQKERRSTIPLVRAKFNSKLAAFIAQCYKIIAQTNHDASENATAKRDLANQMLHLFIGTRLIYDKEKPELPNVVYSISDMNGVGDVVRLNGQAYNLHNTEQFNKFKQELQKCEIMPSWTTLNSPLRVLQNSSFKFLYDHFSSKDEAFKIAIDGVDSGLTVTKNNLNNDTLVQWMIRNHFFATRFFIKNDVSFSMHNLTLGNKIQNEVKQDAKQTAQIVAETPKQPTPPAQPSVQPEVTVPNVLEDGEEIVSYDDEDDEDSEYSTPLVRVDKNYAKVRNLNSIEDAIKLIAKHYKRLAKLMQIAYEKVGPLNVKFVVSDEQGEWKVINGVMRQHRGQAHRNEDGSWEITFYQGNPDIIKTLAHEVIHIFTINQIEKKSGKYSQTANAIFAACLDVLTQKERQAYGLKNAKEFIAEFFTNEELINILKRRAPLPDSVINSFLTEEERSQLIKPRSTFESIIHYIANLWRTKILRQKPSTYSQIYNIMEQVFSEAVSDTTSTADESEYGERQDRRSIRSKFENLFDIASSKLTGGVSVMNHVTGKTYKIENAINQDQVKRAATGILTEMILNADITPLGKNIDKFTFSAKDIIKKLESIKPQDVEFKNWFYRTFVYNSDPLIAELAKVTQVTDESLKSEENPEGFVFKYRTATVKRKDGSTYKKKIPYVKLDIAKWGAITPFMDQAMAELRIETIRDAQNRIDEQELQNREDGVQNDQGYYNSEDYEVDPFDRASQEVKWLFSTIPYGTIQNGQWVPATDRNKWGFREFIPFRNVYGKVLYYTSDCRTTQDMINKFAILAENGPDKALFKYLQEKLMEFQANKWISADKATDLISNPTTNQDGSVFNADAECMLIKVVRALRQQQNDFKWAVVEDDVDDKGNKSKHIDIKTTIYQKGIIMSMNNWMDQLSTGLTGILKYNTKTQKFEFRGEDNVFYKIYSDLFIGDDSFINAYNKSKMDHPQDITVNWRYMEKPIPFSEVTAEDVKTYLHNALLDLGVDVQEEVIDDWLLQIMKNNPTVETQLDALYVLLADRNSNHMPINFFATLGETIDGLSVDVIRNAFSTGFIRELANRQNEYQLRTRNLMTVAAHNNQYYIVSERNYVNDIAEIINTNDENDSYIQMIKEDAFAKGSVISEMVEQGETPGIKVSTFVGMKTKNPGDAGRDYFEIELTEDFISKLELLHEGYMISPTTSDKKSYHVLEGVPLVGMRVGEKSNIRCYSADLKKMSIDIFDNDILDRFITYFESEKNAVEKAIQAYESKFYENNPGKKIANYSDQNGMYFSSFNCVFTKSGEPIYLNLPGLSPREGLNRAYSYFFNLPQNDKRNIMRKILADRAKEDLNKTLEFGLIKLEEDGLYSNVGLDDSTIVQMAENIIQAKYGSNARLGGTANAKYNNTSKKCISLAIQQYLLDCSVKHLQSMQEYQRLFSGSKSFYKWKNNGTHITDISEDYTKRRGGDISTGGVNISDIDPIAGMEEVGTYRCIELQDEKIESTTLNKQTLQEEFEYSELISVAIAISKGNKSPMSIDDSIPSVLKSTSIVRPEDLDQAKKQARKEIAENIIRARFGQGYLDILKEKARANANAYFKTDDPKAKNPINVADGATYVTDRMCEKLLREEGKWDDKMKYAFEVLRGEHGADVLAEEGAELYKSILDLIVGTQKYTATGFRKSDDGQGGTLMTPYYNKTALFPIFEQIAYGRMAQFLQAMRKNNVDMVMMTSAVKVGSQGAIKLDELLSDVEYKDHSYVQEMRFLRKQLNTDPNGREESPLGTQTIKIALSNLRMDDDYVNPLTGKQCKGRELYQDIMRCYNILTDIGFEQVMRRFCKLNKDGDVVYNNVVVSRDSNQQHSSQPVIDKKALADFLYSEMMSRDANNNMLDACMSHKVTKTVTTDQGETTVEDYELNAPISAISQSGWIDSIITSLINKTIIDTQAPGVPYVQRSVLGMEGFGDKTINNGQELQLKNPDGSMDAVISIDFFKDVIPDYENKTFEQARDWLIKHKLIGPEAKTFTISYRIPTQAQSSINPLKFVDVIPIVRDTIILPKDFVSLTGSDFDIDKLYLSRLNINMENIEDPDQMFIYSNSVDPNNKKETLDTLKNAFTNRLLSSYITLLMDKNSANTKWRSIDKDTQLWEDVYNDLYNVEKSPIQSMSQDTLAYQTQVKNNFVVGKIGIGPFALANNNHIYTMLYNISLSENESSWLHSVGRAGRNMGTLYGSHDMYGNSILSWLSGGINVHVDIAKDPFVTSMNINKYTYNIAIFMLRAGFGRNALWFLNQPVIKELARRQNLITGEYLKQSNKDLFTARQEVMDKYKEELLKGISAEVLNRKIQVPQDISELYGAPLTLKNFIIPSEFQKLKKTIAKKYKSLYGSDGVGAIMMQLDDMYTYDILYKYRDDLIEEDKEQSMIYRMAKFGGFSLGTIQQEEYTLEEAALDQNVQKYMQVVIFDRINSNEARTASQLTKFTKIDTKKQGSTIAAQTDFMQGYNEFIAKITDQNSPVSGDIKRLFGDDSQGLLGFDTSLTLFDYSDNLQSISTLISTNEPGGDITDLGYIQYTRDPFQSFVHNKTLKAINAVKAILHDDSVEGTYGFSIIWRAVKSDFGKGSLTEDQQSKLRSVILGAIKSRWLVSKMKDLDIDPVSLFRDQNGTLSLAHELVKLKSTHVRYVTEDGRKTIGTIANKYKNNVLLNLLYDAHAKDEVAGYDNMYEILDFIKVHIPFTDDSKGANPYISAWEELYNDDVTREFAVKLMFYAYLTSNDSGGNNLVKYIPYKMLQAYNLFDAERDMIRFLNDPMILFGGYAQAKEGLQDIIEDIESILVEDFAFSTPLHLETLVDVQDSLTGQLSKKPEAQYIGYGNVFGNSVIRNGRKYDTEGIPFLFVPVKMGNNGIYASETLSVYDKDAKQKRPISTRYIRVYNPIKSYENPQTYLTYKKIGEIVLGKGVKLPIYKLVNSSMYSLGQYKVYNWSQMMDIKSSETRFLVNKYIQTENYSIEDLDAFVSDVMQVVRAQNTAREGLDEVVLFDEAAEPIALIDERMKSQRKDNINKDYISFVKEVLLPMYDNEKYKDFFKNANTKGKKTLLSSLEIVKNSNQFTKDERLKIADMLQNLKKLQEEIERDGNSGTAPKSANDPKEFFMRSGGAWGADSDWADTAVKYGMIDDPEHISHYYQDKKTPRGNRQITPQEFNDGVDQVIIADQTLHRLDNMTVERQRAALPLFARNWLQVKNSDAVFAIGQLSYGTVNGGTGWAVQMAIDHHKPVHVFNLSDEHWYVYDQQQRLFVQEETPKLTKNFAGIGTRSIDPDIEEKTKNYKKPVKYVGDEKRQAALNAMDNVFRKTFGSPKPQNPQSDVDKATAVILGNNPEMGEGTARGTAQAMSSNNNPEFTQGDRNLKDEIGGNPLKVVMASEHTDPAFHSKKVCDAINEDLKKPKAERKYHMLQIMTKHDGLPLLRMLELKIPKSVHFSISSLGGTQYEPGVMKMDDLMNRIEKFIKDGKLKPQTTTIRIDPIIPGVTKMEDVAHIMERAAKMGVRSIKVSIMDSYGYNEQAKARGVMDNMQRLGYNFDQYYSKYQAKETSYDKYGKLERKAGEWYWSQDARPEVMSDLYQKVDELAQKYGVFCTTCGEKPNTSYQFKKLSFAQGCLNATGVASVLGVKKEDVEAATKIGNQRPGKCNCLNCKSDVLAYDDTCNSQCAYCYAKHGSKLAMKYYNEDGTLKDNEFTRTEEQPVDDNSQTPNISGFDVESWSKKEGWSEEYFYKKVAPRLHEAWQVEFELMSHATERTDKPAYYTYQDGTTVRTPFELTDEQKGALERIEDFIKDPTAKVLTVSGYAGTGKTSVMQIVAEKHKSDAHVVFTASTNKASGVLGSKVRKKGFNSSTLDTFFGFIQGRREGASRYDARNTETMIRPDMEIPSGSIVIIDEASMIGKEKYNLINRAASQFGCKIIYLGDIAQLPPVGESVGPVFTNADNLVQLTEVKRTGDNAILKEATRLREPNGTFSYESEFNSKNEGVGFTSDIQKIKDVIKKFASGLKDDLNFLKIVTGTNPSVEGYNDFVRQCLGYDQDVPQVGEILMGYDNWGRLYNKLTGESTYKLVNSEEYIISSVGQEKIKKVFLSDDFLEIKYREVVVKNTSGKEITIPYTPYDKNEDSLKQIAQYIQQMYIRANKTQDRRARAAVFAQIGELKNSFICDRNITDTEGNVIVKKSIDYGYAITAYKSQGSTYTNIIIDQNNIRKVPGWDSQTKQRMYYTAISRATTTATVLTNSTKKEGTPLETRVPVVHQFGMYFAYNGQGRPGLMANTTFDAILGGERTATTRYESDYTSDRMKHQWDEWQKVQVGDEIIFYDNRKWHAARQLRVRVTVAPHKLDVTQSSNTKKVSVSTSTYTKESVSNPRVAVVFTENLQADIARRNNTPSSKKLTTMVSEGSSGTNQAVVRMSDANTYNQNAFGLIVKLNQQDETGKWAYGDNANFTDSDAMFNAFKKYNTEMFDRLDVFDCDEIIFPQSAAMGKAALPKRFAEWLAQELYDRYGLFTVVAPNNKYSGKYGIYIYPASDKINIKHPQDNYIYSTQMPYTNLSNFAERPFKTKLRNGGQIVDVDSVEQAFQMAKLVFVHLHGGIDRASMMNLFKQMITAKGAALKALGSSKNLSMSSQIKAEWDKISDQVLKVMMEKSFLADANSNARAELLRTGNAQFTHNFENGNPIEKSTRFQDALKEIRDKIRQNEQTKKNC